MQAKMRNTRENPVDPLILMVFPGDAGSTQVYEDQGNSLGYQKGECAWTRVTMSRRDSDIYQVVILPREGTFPEMVAERSYELRLPGWWPPEEVICNGAEIPYGGDGSRGRWTYDGDKLMTIITLPKFKVDRKVEVVVRTPVGAGGKSGLLDGTRGILSRLRRVMPLLNGTWPKEWSPDTLVCAAQTGNRISINPADATKELSQLRQDLPEVIQQIRALDIDLDVRNRVLNHLSCIGR
jgi:hypothetical protein